MVEWLEQNPIVYNKKLKTYKDTTRKEELWREKATELGKDVLVLKTWYTSRRTRYGRLRKISSGQEPHELTERDAWIVRCFEFLKPHITEVTKRTLVSLKEKISDETEDSQDALITNIDSTDDENPPSVCSDQSPSISVNQPSSSRSKQVRTSKNRASALEDGTFLSSLEERSQQYMTMQKELMSKLKPNQETERDTFVNWIRSALTTLEHPIWRRCQWDLSDIMYRYIAENDRLQTRKQVTSSVSPNQPVTLTQSSTGFCQRPSNQQWQPGPQCWPASIQNPTSVWCSMDSSWMQQQYPSLQFACQPRNKTAENLMQLSDPPNQPTLARSNPTTTQYASTSSTETPLSHFTSLLRNIYDSEEHSSSISTPCIDSRDSEPNSD